jgi:hypothetical protein
VEDIKIRRPELVGHIIRTEEERIPKKVLNGNTDCKGVKNNTNFGQITGIQEKLDTTCK